MVRRIAGKIGEGSERSLIAATHNHNRSGQPGKKSPAITVGAVAGQKEFAQCTIYTLRLSGAIANTLLSAPLSMTTTDAMLKVSPRVGMHRF